MDGFDALGQVKDVFHFSTLSSSNNLDVDNRIPWGENHTKHLAKYEGKNYVQQ